MSAAWQFCKFVVIWRLVVFRNISQRFDSISGMLSMTLVWNQRTTLENEGGGGEKKGLSRRSHWCASINERGGQWLHVRLRPPQPCTPKLQLHSRTTLWQLHSVIRRHKHASYARFKKTTAAMLFSISETLSQTLFGGYDGDPVVSQHTEFG